VTPQALFAVIGILYVWESLKVGLIMCINARTFNVMILIVFLDKSSVPEVENDYEEAD
jgi:hypothetical protein